MVFGKRPKGRKEVSYGYPPDPEKYVQRAPRRTSKDSTVELNVQDGEQ